jgi:hypothetical protein
MTKSEKEFIKVNKQLLQSIGSGWLIERRNKIFEMPRNTTEDVLAMDRAIDNWNSLREFFKDIKLASEDSIKEKKKQDFV